MQPRNLAARAGRWSATHRKTAILGWILFVVLATNIGGNVGQKNLEQAASGNGESKRGSMIVDDAGFPTTVGERVLVQGKGSIKADSPEVTAAVKDVVTPPRQDQGRQRHPEPARREVPREHGLQGRPLRPGDVLAARQGRDRPGPGEARDAGRGSAGPGGRGPEGASRRARAGARRRVAAARARSQGPGGRGEAVAVLHGRHAHPPPAHVRRRRRGRRSAAAGHQRVRGDHGPARPGQPALAAASCRRAGDDADRPCRGCRLRDVLHAPDDRGARQGPLVRRRAGRRRCDLGSCGADLRVHRDGGDGRHVLLGQPDLHLVRHRHDPRGRRGRARVAHVPPGGAVLPRPEELAGEGPRAVRRQASPQERRRVPRVERDPRPRHQAPGRLGRARRRPARRAHAPGARHAVQGGRHRGHVPQRADHPDAGPHRRGVPGRQRAGQHRDQGQGRHHARGQGRDRAAPRQGDRQRSAVRAVQRRGQPREDRRGRVHRRQGQGHRRRLEPLGGRSCATTWSRPPSASCRAPTSP